MDVQADCRFISLQKITTSAISVFGKVQKVKFFQKHKWLLELVLTDFCAFWKSSGEDKIPCNILLIN